MDKKTVDGYGVTVEWDGEILTITAMNRASKTALLGENWRDGSVTIPRDQIAGTAFKGANMLVNGSLTVRTKDGKRYIAHFRKKSHDEFKALADQLA